MKLRDRGCDKLFHALESRVFLPRSTDAKTAYVSPALEDAGAEHFFGHPPHALNTRSAGAGHAISDVPINIDAAQGPALAVIVDVMTAKEFYDGQIVRIGFIDVDPGL